MENPESDEHGVTETEESGGGSTFTSTKEPWDGVTCPKCHKTFSNAQGLRMHHVRVHTRAGRINHGALAHKRQTDEERLAKRRVYQQKLRARYYKEGRNSHGEQKPPGWKPRLKPRKAAKTKKDYYEQSKARYHAQGLNARGEPFAKGSTRSEKSSLAMKESWARRKAVAANGVAAPAQTESPIGDAAKAILLAAKVLRGTMTALKLP